MYQFVFQCDSLNVSVMYSSFCFNVAVFMLFICVPVCASVCFDVNAMCTSLCFYFPIFMLVGHVYQLSEAVCRVGLTSGRDRQQADQSANTLQTSTQSSTDSRRGGSQSPGTDLRDSTSPDSQVDAGKEREF